MKQFILLAGWLAILCSNPAAAEVRDDEIQALREQIRLLSERLDALERDSGHQNGVALAPEPDRPPAAAGLEHNIEEAVEAEVTERLGALSWAERIRWSGDFRYRYEHAEPEGRESRDRNRIRARIGLQARVGDDIRVGFGAASGSEDPVSTNQTLGGGGSHKPLNLDLAYFEWTGLANTTVTGGKYRNPLETAGGSQLVWDSDWRPEGLAFTTGGTNWFAHGLGTWLESDSASAQEEFAYALQAGFRLTLMRDLKFMAGTGYYEIEAAGKGSFFGDGDFFGNSFDPVSGTYLYDYRNVNVFAEFTTDIGSKPLMLFGDWVTNLDADERDTGYAFGLQFGSANRRGAWELAYTWKKVEADAVLGLLTESDFGVGGTDAKGSVLSGAYAFDDSWFFQLSYWLNETGLSTGEAQDIDKLQLDLSFRYR